MGGPSAPLGAFRTGNQLSRGVIGLPIFPAVTLTRAPDPLSDLNTYQHGRPQVEFVEELRDKDVDF